MTSAVPAIELIDVHCELGGVQVLRGVSFAVPAGGITALLGPSGVGKTTTMRHLVGLQWPDEGDVIVEGRSILSMRKTERLELSRRFGVLFQGAGVYGSALWDSMTAEENLLHQLRAQRPMDEDAMRARVAERLRVVGLSASAELPPAALSAGMRRRLALARALVADPEFAVLDSFELGADPVTRRRLCELVARRHGESGGTYVVATQSMEVVRRLADTIVVMWDGRVIEQGPADDLLASRGAEVAQLLSGSTTGPLGMGQGGYGVSRGRPPAIAPASGETGLELPVPLVAAGLLAAITASALWLGGVGPAGLAAVTVLWLVMAAAILRWRQRRITAAGERRRRR